MRRSRVLVGVGICLVGAAAAEAGLTPRAHAGRKPQLKVLAVNVAGRSDVELNTPIEVRFNGRVRPDALTGVAVLGFDATSRTFSVPVSGHYRRRGRTVVFTPAVPTHQRSPLDPDGDFFPVGSPGDLALGNALFPGREYEVRVYGKPHELRVRARGRRPLKESFTTTFTTRERGSQPLYRLGEFGAAPPPATIFTNPPDAPPAVGDAYARRGGVQHVPSDVRLTVFGNGLPLDPVTARQDRNVSLTLVEREGDPTVPYAIAGSTFLEQDEVETALHFHPHWPLPDKSLYALRIRRAVLDVSTQFGYAPNAARQRLRDLHDWLTAAARVFPGSPAIDLPDPPADWISDWPLDRVERGLLKANLLTIEPDSPEIDPEVHLLFTTRDEPVSSARLSVEFDRTDGLFNAALSTADWDLRVPGAVAARLVGVGGDGSDGDFVPVADTVLSLDDFADHTARFRTFRVPAGVTVRIAGSRPGRILATSIEVAGRLVLDGRDGDHAATSTAALGGVHPQNRGGAGGPGGGAGGDAVLAFSDGQTVVSGVAGAGALADDGGAASAADAGRPGAGGATGVGPSATRLLGGGGGGGGARTAGENGGAATAADGATANGAGGSGGAAAAAPTLLAGAPGGGAGGNGVDLAGGLALVAAGGGGGAGGLELRCLETLEVPVGGSVSARGGAGGDGSGLVTGIAAGPGGGGGGGALLLRTASQFALGDATSALDVSGGPGGTQTGAGVAVRGGAGGAGRLRLESPSGGLALPGGEAGTYAPSDVAGPSRAYTNWMSFGVATPRLLDPSGSDVAGFVPEGAAVLVEMQLARTDIDQPDEPARPDVTSIELDQSSSDTSRASDWLPVWVQDRSGVAGGAFGPLPGFDADASDAPQFLAVEGAANGHGYTWVRLRVRFHVDPGLTLVDPVPYVERVHVRFQFN